jgi:hypothetical protein
MKMKVVNKLGSHYADDVSLACYFFELGDRLG